VVTKPDGIQDIEVRVEYPDHTQEVLLIVGVNRPGPNSLQLTCRPPVNLNQAWNAGFEVGVVSGRVAAVTGEGLKGKPIEIDRDVEGELRKQIADLRKANEQLRTDNKVLNDRIANLRRVVDNEHNDNETLQAQVLDQQRRLGVQFTTLEELRKDNRERTNTIAELRERNDAQERLIKAMRDQLGREHEDTARLIADVRRTTRETCEKEFTESGAYRSAYALGRKQGHIDAGKSESHPWRDVINDPWPDGDRVIGQIYFKPVTANEVIAAFETLKRLGYAWHGGAEWKPPLGASLFDRENGR